MATYYSKTYDAYSKGWSSEHLHYGIWESDTDDHQESLTNTVDLIAKYLDISSDDRVLDAGCGVGGASRFIAAKYQASMTGIMLSQVHHKRANELKSQFDFPELVDFHEMDYTSTTFKDGQFSKIFGLESVCHADNKSDMVREAFRILEVGGRLLISDGYLLREPTNKKEWQVYNEWLEGWFLPNLISPSDGREILEAEGFKDIQYIDLTDKIRKSSERMYRSARFSKFVHLLIKIFGLSSNYKYKSARSAYLQKFLVDWGIVGYGFLIGNK